MAALQDRLMDPRAYQTFVREFTAEWNKVQGALSATQDGKRDELGRTDASIKRLVTAIENGTPGEAVNDRLRELQARKTTLAAELEHAEAPAPRLMPNLATLYRDKVATLRATLDENEDEGKGARQAIRALIEEIRLILDSVDPKAALAVELRGNLAALLALGSGSQADASAALASQLKVGCGGTQPPKDELYCTRHMLADGRVVRVRHQADQRLISGLAPQAEALSKIAMRGAFGQEDIPCRYGQISMGTGFVCIPEKVRDAEAVHRDVRNNRTTQG